MCVCVCVILVACGASFGVEALVWVARRVAEPCCVLFKLELLHEKVLSQGNSL